GDRVARVQMLIAVLCVLGRVVHLCVAFATYLRPPTATLFPYTTLFRSYQPTVIGHPPEAAFNDPTPAVSLSHTDGDTAGVGSLKDRKSTRLNSSHVKISYAVFCLKKKKIAREEGTDGNEVERADLDPRG